MFQQIVIIDETGLRPWAIEQFRELSSNPVRLYDSVPASDEETVRRIKDADCVFVSWNTRLTDDVLSQCPRLAYVGMCCSLYSAESANVDIDFANANNIHVDGIRDYGDEGVVEFVISELIRLLLGVGDQQWQGEPVELANRKVGIIGLGTVGLLLANRLQDFGTELFYFSRSRKQEAERSGITHLPIGELLETVEIVSTHLPRNTIALGPSEFERFGAGKILVNTSLGLPVEIDSFSKWIEDPTNFAILDADGAAGLPESLRSSPQIIHSPIVAGWTNEAKERLSKKVLSNVMRYLKRI